MSYSLYSRDICLGRTTDELPALDGWLRTWILEPTPAFGEVRQLFAHMNELAQEFTDRLDAEGLDGADAGDDEVGRVRSLVERHPELRGFADVQRSVADLALELHDEDGTRLECEYINVVELDGTMSPGTASGSIPAITARLLTPPES